MSSKKDSDVEMKDTNLKEKDKKADDKDKKPDEKKAEEKKKEEPKLSPRDQTLKDIRDIIKTISEESKLDRRQLARVARAQNLLRKRVNADILTSIAKQYYPETIEWITLVEGKVMKDDPALAAPKDGEKKAEPVVYAPSPPQPDPVPSHLVLPEIKVFVHLLVTQYVVDTKAVDESVKSFLSLKKLLDSHNRRTLDHFSARVYYLWSLVYERAGQLANIRDELLLAHRTSTLQHNDPGTASLINAILRNYLHYHLFEQAAKFHDKAPFPPGRTNNESARYLYYQGRIEAVQLRYSDAYASLSQALRKAPVKSAVGFRQRANKLLCIVQLLMGDIPERSLFRQPDLKRSLKPYFRLTQAVRVGDVAAFKDAQSKFKESFVRDGTYSLIVRLYQNVIKTGLRKINLSYSKISIRDIIQKLNMQGMEKKSEDAEKDMEYIVAKAIHDGVIDAAIDHKGKFVYSKENVDVYSTHEPQAAFHKRIRFCTDVHNEAVKALQFPPNASKPKVEYEAFPDEDDDLDTDSKEKAPLADDDDH